MDDVDQDGAHWEPVLGQAFFDTLGPLLMRTLPNGEPRYAIRLEERHLNHYGIVHGGVILSFLDHALGIYAGRTHDAPAQATMNLSVSFVDAGQAGDLLEAEVEPIRTTRSVMFVRGTARVGTKVVATADGVWKLRRPRG